MRPGRRGACRRPADLSPPSPYSVPSSRSAQPVKRAMAGLTWLGQLASEASVAAFLLDLGARSKVYPAGMALTVSALASQVGLSADTVRYYERVGLLPEPARSAAGYRLYDQAAVGRLRLIKGAQRAGLRLREIGELLQVADQGQCPCGHTETLLRERLAEVRAELDRLRALEADLVGLLERRSDPSCPEATTTAAASWWCADPRQPAERSLN